MAMLSGAAVYNIAVCSDSVAVPGLPPGTRATSAGAIQVPNTERRNSGEVQPHRHSRAGHSQDRSEQSIPCTSPASCISPLLQPQIAFAGTSMPRLGRMTRSPSCLRLLHRTASWRSPTLPAAQLQHRAGCPGSVGHVPPAR